MGGGGRLPRSTWNTESVMYLKEKRKKERAKETSKLNPMYYDELMTNILGLIYLSILQIAEGRER